MARRELYRHEKALRIAHSIRGLQLAKKKERDLRNFTRDVFVQEIENKRTSGEPINFIYNLEHSPETLGDLVPALMLAKFVRNQGLNIRFFIVDFKRQKRWNVLSKAQQDRIVLNLISISRYVLNESFFYHNSKNANKPLIGLSGVEHLEFGKISFFPLFSVAPIVLKSLIDEGYAPGKDFLFQSNKRENAVGIHVRDSSTDVRRNFVEKQFISDVISLRNCFPDTEIRVFSSRNGLVRAMRVIESERNSPAGIPRNTNVLPQKSSSFTECFDEIPTLQFYFQRNAGGLGTIPMFSEIPALSIAPDFTNFPIRFRKMELNWLSSNQAHIRIPMDKQLNMDLSLELLMNKYKVGIYE